METFRCPTCVAVLIDPNARRCPTCRHLLRRKTGPRVLGDEKRQKMLPIDHWMRARIDAPPTTTAGRRRRQAEPLPWAGRFEPAGRETDVAMPVAPSALIDLEIAEIEAPPMITLDDDGLAAYLPRPAAMPDEPAPGPGPAVAIAPVPVEQLEADLDPDVQALVDDLYRRARAELANETAPSVEARARGWDPAVLAEPEGTED